SADAIVHRSFVHPRGRRTRFPQSALTRQPVSSERRTSSDRPVDFRLPPSDFRLGRYRSFSRMLQVKNLTKVYDNGTVALEDVSFAVPDGQFLAVIGLSGSGKSTLLRCINRLIEPTEGQILWNGEDVTHASQEDLRRFRRRVGMVFQHFNLVHRSKVLTNVLAGRLGYTNPAMALFNRFSKEDVAGALAQLERVGLREKAFARADELSGGQQQ